MSDLIYNQIAQNSINIVSDMPSVGIHVPDTNVGELISRAEAIRIASGYCHPSNIAKELAKLPSAQAEPCDFCIHKDDCEDMKMFCPAEGRNKDE